MITEQIMEVISTQLCLNVWQERSSHTFTALLPRMGILLLAFPELWQLLVSAHCAGSHSTRTPFKTGQSNMPLASGQPLPSATAAQLQQLVTSSHSHHLSQKVCLFTKPRQTWHLPRRQVQSPSRVIRAWQWKMKDWDWCSEARVWMMLSSAFSRTGGGGKSATRDKRRGRGGGGLSSGRGRTNVIPVWYTLICVIHLRPSCECEGRWAGTCQTLYGMQRLFINH